MKERQKGNYNFELNFFFNPVYLYRRIKTIRSAKDFWKRLLNLAILIYKIFFERKKMESEKIIFSEQEERYMKLGYEYMERNEWGLAKEEFKKVLNSSPNNIWGYIELGKIATNMKEYDSAISCYEKALKINPEQEQIHTGLGKIYRILGKNDLAMEEFETALKINSENKKLKVWLKKVKEVVGWRRKIPPYRVIFTWGMHYKCNYRCSYCYTPKPDDPDFEKNTKNKAVYPGTKKLIAVWSDIARRYGSCRIRLDGGEPSVYPDFIELVRNLSRIHRLQINTNLSFDVNYFTRRVSAERVRVDASFHPEYHSFEEFSSKIKILNDKNFKIVVTVVAYPTFTDEIEKYRIVTEGLDIPFIVHPYSGEYKGKFYPGDYTQEEIKKIYKADETSKTELKWRKEEKPVISYESNCPINSNSIEKKVRICRMGQMYARIYPNGDVYRCCTDDGLMNLGNLFDGSFALLEEPEPCEHPGCRCWRCMSVGEEDRWLLTWLDDWEMPQV